MVVVTSQISVKTRDTLDPETINLVRPGDFQFPILLRHDVTLLSEIGNH